MEVIAGRGLYQIYPGGVLANEDVNLSVEKGEIHALVGENGAGKSTLMKMLYGEIAPTKGKILVKGRGSGVSLLQRSQWKKASAWCISILCRFLP